MAVDTYWYYNHSIIATPVSSDPTPLTPTTLTIITPSSASTLTAHVDLLVYSPTVAKEKVDQSDSYTIDSAAANHTNSRNPLVGAKHTRIHTKNTVHEDCAVSEFSTALAIRFQDDFGTQEPLETLPSSRTILQHKRQPSLSNTSIEIPRDRFMDYYTQQYALQ